MAEGEGILYGLLLVDEYDTPYNTAQTFTDKQVWDFIHTDRSILNGRHEVGVPLPAGYTTESGETTASATSGSFDNDLAQEATGIRDPQGNEVMSDLVFDTDAEDEDEGGDGGDEWTRDAKAALTKLGVKPENIYEGLWY